MSIGAALKRSGYKVELSSNYLKIQDIQLHKIQQNLKSLHITTLAFNMLNSGQ
jgi:hypothetical protein